MLALDLNNLIYDPDTDPSVSINKQTIIRYPEKSTYKDGEKMSFILSGTTFLNGENSSLTLGLKAESVDSLFSFGLQQGSIFNIVNRVRILSPSGDSISDVLKHNVFSAITNRMKLSQEYHSVLGKSFGSKTANFNIADTHYFQLPLKLLSPFFNSKHDNRNLS